jgi:DNA (cytosine-5)-methyltransferase 1
MNYLSVCSGIEAATVAWHPLGWNPVGFSEIESFPSQVLKHHYPTVPNLGDMTKFKEWEIESNIDVLVGGTPCQSFSVAGLRKGLDDPRGNLMLTYLAIAKQYRPRWLVWENVPGVLSSADGRDFGSFLGGLAICGYGFAYRVLDAQYFGVAQRRKRVFVVGYLGDWRPAAAVLFERESLQGNPAPSRKKGERVAPCVTNGPPFSRTGNERVEAEAMIVADCGVEISGPLSARDYKDAGTDGMNKISAKMIPVYQETVGALCADTHPGSYSGQDAYTGRLIPQPIPFDTTQITSPQNGNNPKSGDPCHPLAAGAHPPAIVQSIEYLSAYSIREDAKANTFSATELEVANALKALQPSTQSHHAQTFIAQPVGTDLYNGTITGDIACTFTADATSATHSGPTVMQSMAVRRLTPVECERLQGFPDHYTDIKSKGKQTPDGPRYKALGNSMAVPVMNWIGQKIQKVEDLIK